MSNLVELKPKHKAVARLLALGVPLPDICSTYNLNYDTWTQTCRAPLFKAEVASIQDELTDRMIDETIKDPSVARLKTLSAKAITALESELENHNREDGATAASRIKAADSILDRAGYIGKTEQLAPSVVIEISAGKMEFVEKALARA
jgi:hypothetical protein